MQQKELLESDDYFNTEPRTALLSALRYDIEMRCPTSKDHHIVAMDANETVTDTTADAFGGIGWFQSELNLADAHTLHHGPPIRQSCIKEPFQRNLSDRIQFDFLPRHD